MRKGPNHLLVVLVLLMFSVFGVARHLHMYGEDLASSYVGCRLLAQGNGTHLYSHDARDFRIVGDAAWYDVATRAGFAPLRLLHPYVQTPLWAWSLEPVCTRVSFRVFCDGFIVLIMLCTSALLFLVARYWTPALFHPGWIALIFAALYVSEPFKYSIFLAQTHILFLLLSVVALMLATRQRSVWAGVVLALAAMVKITPGFVCVYWLFTRQWKAAASFAVAFVALTLLGALAVGPEVSKAYFHSLSENGDVLLVAFNNQSFAGWWMGYTFPRSEVLKWWIYRLPLALKAGSLLLSIAGAALGGWLDRVQGDGDRPLPDPPYGGVLALVAATVFAPIAWSHYYILLVVPAMLLLQANQEDHRRRWLVVLMAVFALNLYPISFGDVHLYYKSFSLVRSQFYSGVLTMAVLVYLGVLRRQNAERALHVSGRIL